MVAQAPLGGTPDRSNAGTQRDRPRDIPVEGEQLRLELARLGYSPGGSGVTDHGALTGLTPDDDHPQYAKVAAGAFTTLAPTSAVAATGATELVRKGEMDTAIAAGVGVTDHGALTGLADDDHPQYARVAAGAFTTVAPTSAVAATGATDLVRKGEMDTAIGGVLADVDAGDVIADAAAPGVITWQALGPDTAGQYTTATADGQVLLRESGVVKFRQIKTTELEAKSVTYTTIQDVTATDRILGRSTVGPGVVEEIACTAAGRDLIDDATAADQRATLGVTDAFATFDMGPAIDGSMFYADSGAVEILFPEPDGTTLQMGGGLPRWASPESVRQTIGAQALHGFPLQADGTAAVVVTYNTVARTVTLTAAAGVAFDLYVQGALITVASPFTSTAHAATTGNHFLYHDGSAWTWSTSPWDLMVHAPACLVYYSAIAGSGVAFIETHSTSRDPALHRRLHEIEGTALVSGGVLSGYTLTTDTDVGVTYAISQATIVDEDLHVTVAAVADGGPYTVWHRSGASGEWTWTTGLSLPWTVSTYATFNENTGATWQLTSLGANNFGTFYVVALGSVTSGHSFVIVPGQTAHATLGAAQTESFASLSLGTVAWQEFAVVAKVIVQAKASYGGTSKTRIEQVDRLTGSRSLSVSSGASQPLDTFLTSIAALGTAADRYIYTTGIDTAAEGTITAAGRAILDDADATAQRVTLGLVIGTNVQAQDAELAAIAGLTSAADRVPYFTGSGTASLATFTSAGRDLVDDATAADQRTTLGLGTLAVQSTRSMVVQNMALPSGLAWTNMPAAHTMLLGNTHSIRRVDLTSYTQCRLCCVQFGAAASGAKLRLRYGAAGTSAADSWTIISSSEVELSLGTGAGTQYIETSWVNLVAGAKADIYVAVTGISGDGAADPTFFSVHSEFR